MKTANKYDYLLKCSPEEINDLAQAACRVTKLIEQNRLDEANKAQFFAVMRTIIQRGDTSSYCCVNLLRDIKADELHGFLLDELRKDIFINEPGISSDFRNFINAILDFDQGKTKVLSFPSLYRKSRDSTDVEIKWS